MLTGGTFSSDHTALKSRWGDAKSRRGDADYRWENTSPLQFKYCAMCIIFKFQYVALKCYYAIVLWPLLWVARIANLHRKVSKIESWAPPPFLQVGHKV